MVIPSAPRTTELSETDQWLVDKEVISRELALTRRGFNADEVAEILEGEANALAAKVNAEAEQLAQQTDGLKLADGEDGDGEDDDDDFEDDGADDDASLRAYREARMAELKASQARCAGSAGELLQVSKATWEEEVVAASADQWVVVHLHADGAQESQTGRGVPAQCAAIAASLRELAARHTGGSAPRFCQIPALEAIPPSQLARLPALFCYRDGKLQQSVMGPAVFGAAPSAVEVAARLAECGVLSAAAAHAGDRGGAVSDHDSDDLSD